MTHELDNKMGAGATAGAWVIENGLVVCRVVQVDGELLWDLRPTNGGVGLSIGPCPVPDLAVAGWLVGWEGTLQVTDRMQADGSRVLRVALEDPRAQLAAARYFQLFPGQPFVRLWGTLQNQGDLPLVVTESQILSLGVRTASPLVLFHVEQFSWVYRRDFFSQNQVWLVPGKVPAEIRMGSFPSRTWEPTSCAWFALRDGPPDRPGETPRSGQGLVAGIEFNGKSRLRAWADLESVSITSAVDPLNHHLGPGETFAVPACFVGLYEGDWDQAGYVTQRFAEAYVHPPMPDDRYPWVQYNSWGYGQDIDEAQQLEAVERSARMGVEVVVLDLGWAAEIGDWRAHPGKFPRGLAPIADRAHELGMKFGVHIPLAQANVSSPVARQHPDWLIHTGNDYFGAAPICLGHRPCREWLIGELVRMIDAHHLDYIVHDGEDMVKCCPKTTHTHAPGDSNYANSEQGLDLVIQTVRQLRPDVVWENCEDGGCMLTYKMARNYHSTITVDNIATYATRQGIYGASYPFSPRYSVRYMQDDPTPYTLRSAIFGGPLILMQQVTEWSQDQMVETSRAIEEYKGLRGLVRDAKVVHLLAPRYNVEGIGWGWDAIQAVSANQVHSVVLVYRAVGGPDRQTIRPRGLGADAVYSVHLVDQATTLELDGAQLERDGLEIALDELSSEVMRFELIA
jgi:hypothetical protein